MEDNTYQFWYTEPGFSNYGFVPNSVELDEWIDQSAKAAGAVIKPAADERATHAPSIKPGAITLKAGHEMLHVCALHEASKEIGKSARVLKVVAGNRSVALGKSARVLKVVAGNRSVALGKSAILILHNQFTKDIKNKLRGSVRRTASRRGLTSHAETLSSTAEILEIDVGASPVIENFDRFEPSDELAQYVANAISRQIQGEQSLAALTEGEEPEQQQEASEKSAGNLSFYKDPDKLLATAKITLISTFTGTLGTLARGLRHGGYTGDIRLTEDGIFLSSIIELMFEELPIDWYSINPFLTLLYKELVPVARSGKLGGSWGSLILLSNDLFLRIKPRPTSKK